MKKLTPNNIKFIDTYLKNSDIIFTDIRIEIIDHIASEIEFLINNGDCREFYYVFKDYMVVNKNKLIKDRKVYYKASDKKIFRMLFKIFFSFQGLVIFLLTLFSFNLINEFVGDKAMLAFVKMAPFILLIIIGITYFFFIKKKEERFSSIERIAFYFAVLGQFINIMTHLNIATISMLTGLKISASLFILVLVLLIITAFKLKKEYVLNMPKLKEKMSKQNPEYNVAYNL